MSVGPFFPPIDPFVLPEDPFDNLLAAYGVRLMWRKSHVCPCIQGGPIPGSADPACRQCQGRGIYWDAPSQPFMGLLTWRHMSPTPDEYGAMPHEVAGLIQHGEPSLTIPFTDGASGQIWNQASVYDAFVEPDALDRFTTVLNVSGITAVPYQQGLVIQPSGAVTTYNQPTSSVVTVSGYVVSGANVFLPSGYAPGTAYTVEFQANPVFVALRKAGALPMTRPFGGGVVNLPRRFRVQTLDLWTRSRQFPGDAGPQGI